MLAVCRRQGPVMNREEKMMEPGGPPMVIALMVNVDHYWMALFGRKGNIETGQGFWSLINKTTLLESWLNTLQSGHCLYSSFTDERLMYSGIGEISQNFRARLDFLLLFSGNEVIGILRLIFTIWILPLHLQNGLWGKKYRHDSHENDLLVQIERNK